MNNVIPDQAHLDLEDVPRPRVRLLRQRCTSISDIHRTPRRR